MEKKDSSGRVELFIPRGGVNEEQTLTVGVNGVTYLLPKGKKSMVPQSVAREVRRSWQAQEELETKSAALAGKQGM